jgi:hypothetical protein
MKCENCKKIIEEYEKYLDDYKKEQRELVRQEVLKLIDKIKLPTDKDYRYSNDYIEAWMEKLKEELRK